MNLKQFRGFLEFFEYYREQGLTPEVAFMKAWEDYVFVYGDDTVPLGVLGSLEESDLKGGDAVKQ